MEDLAYEVLAMVVAAAIVSLFYPLSRTRPRTTAEVAMLLVVTPAGGGFAGLLTGHLLRGLAVGFALGLTVALVPPLIYAARRRIA